VTVEVEGDEAVQILEIGKVWVVILLTVWQNVVCVAVLVCLFTVNVCVNVLEMCARKIKRWLIQSTSDRRVKISALHTTEW
jgi:hypothetical protein